MTNLKLKSVNIFAFNKINQLSLNTLNKEYYNRNPYGLIEPGDIFTNLPTMGLMKSDFTPGIIITPACDLANGKTETITYLPVVPLKDWLCSVSFYPEFRSHFHSLWNQFELLAKSPLSKQIEGKEIIELLKDELSKINLSVIKDKKKEVHNQILLCFELLENMMNDQCINHDYNKVKRALPKIEQSIAKVVSNSYASDLHFLPIEDENIEKAYTLKNYSIVMFRFPITVPFEVLDIAKDINIENSASWSAHKNSRPNKVCYSSFNDLPMRGLRLNQEYLSDLLTRYISLYVRIGSPDFGRLMTEEIINKIDLQMQK